MTTFERVGFIGLGGMGRGLVKNLVAKGAEVTAYDLNPAAMAVANWYVAFHFSTDTWVNFKVWGGIGLFLLFALAQGVVLARHVSEPAP